MKNLCFLVIFLCLFPFFAVAQLTGNKNIPGDYVTLQAAVADLNSQGVGPGGVILNILAGNPQAAPAGGYIIGGSGSILLTTATASNPVIISGNGNTITSSSTQTVGAINDALIKIIGADYITVQDLVLQENPVNTINTPAASNNMTEFGIALFYVTPTDGAQNNTIRANTISLDRNYRNTFGIYSNTSTTATDMSTAADITSASGSNSSNKIYSNSISNINFGVILIGSSTAANMDTGNDIGGTSNITGNVISNAGSSASALSTYLSLTTNHYTIFCNHQLGDNISYNTITSAALTSIVSEGGILNTYTVGQPAGTFTSNITNNSITVTNSPTAATGGTMFIINNGGITTYLPTATFNINNNRIQNCDLGGNMASTQSFTGIFNSSAAGVVNINDNLFVNNSISASTSKGNTQVITNNSACGTLNVNNNIFRGFTNTSLATTLTEGYFISVFTSGAIVNAININNNSFGDPLGDLFTKTNADFFFADIVEVYGGAPTSTLNVNGNSFKGINAKRLSAPGSLDGSIGILTNSAVQCNTININNNNFGTDDGNYITYNDVNSGEMWGIINQGGSASGSVSISGNNFRKFVHAVTGSSIVTFIFNSFGTLTQNINNNLFTDLNINSSGNLTFIRNFSVTWPANAVSNVNNNQIMGSFTKAAGAGVRFYLSTGTATALSEFNNNNNISNLTVNGNTFLEMIRSQVTNSTRTISGNTFSNITAATGNVIGFVPNNGSNSIFNNTINNIGSQSAITGIFLQQDMQSSSVNGNRISNLVSTTASAVTGINVNGITTTHNIYQNKIYNLRNNTVAAGSVNGITVASGQDVTLYNNLIGNLTAPTANSTTDVIRGINLLSAQANSNIKVYYNIVYLDATSTGTDFSSSALYHVASTTPTTANLTLRNNILINTSIPNGGTGNSSAVRRTVAALDNYAATSNNNLFFAGTPGAGRNLLSDDVNFFQTLTALKAGLTPRESNSVSELPAFLSTNGADANYLHLNFSTPSAATDGGSPITGITSDYDGDTRNTLTPDIGADESVSVLSIAVNYFRGRKNGEMIDLEWKVNCDDDETIVTVERKAAATGFVALANFTTTVIQSLQAFYFSDASPAMGTNLYRLKIRQKSGKIIYSNILSYNFAKGGNMFVYPNPIHNSAVFSITLASASSASLRILDISGKEVYKQVIRMKAGNNKIPLDLKNLSPGMYILSVDTETGKSNAVSIFKE